jgi:uncharacterized surface protein with fasciclin (FAS1) repeats
LNEPIGLTPGLSSVPFTVKNVFHVGNDTEDEEERVIVKDAVVGTILVVVLTKGVIHVIDKVIMPRM